MRKMSIFYIMISIGESFTFINAVNPINIRKFKIIFTVSFQILILISLKSF